MADQESINTQRAYRGEPRRDDGQAYRPRDAHWNPYTATWAIDVLTWRCYNDTVPRSKPEQRSEMSDDIAIGIRRAARLEDMEMTLHAVQEAFAEHVGPDEIRQALLNAVLIEDYPEHRRGPCCLVCGVTNQGRSLHVVCTTRRSPMLIITVYEPKMPKWLTPMERNK